MRRGEPAGNFFRSQRASLLPGFRETLRSQLQQMVTQGSLTLSADFQMLGEMLGVGQPGSSIECLSG